MRGGWVSGRRPDLSVPEAEQMVPVTGGRELCKAPISQSHGEGQGDLTLHGTLQPLTLSLLPRPSRYLPSPARWVERCCP